MQMPSACGYLPVTRTGQPLLGRGTINCPWLPKPRHPRVTIPPLPWLLGRICVNIPLGSRKSLRASQTAFSQNLSLAYRIYGKQQGIALLENFFITFLEGNILLVLDWSLFACWQILATFTPGKVKPSEQLDAPSEPCSCKIQAADPTQLPWGAWDLYLGT